MSAKKENISLIQLLSALLFPFFFPVLVLFLSGDWLWVEGLIWGLWFVSLCLFVTIYLYIFDPALLKERFQHQGIKNQKSEQAYWIYLTFLVFLAWIIVMPIDAKKCAWSEFPAWVEAIGAIGLIPAFYFIFRAFYDNTFLSPLIRVQKERKQKVITTGSYGVVRHPMYLGAACMFIATPLLLGSMFGLLLGILLVLCLVPRILGEERMMVEELDGYNAYKKKVKYRLIPYIW